MENFHLKDKRYIWWIIYDVLAKYSIVLWLISPAIQQLLYTFRIQIKDNCVWCLVSLTFIK